LNVAIKKLRATPGNLTEDLMNGVTGAVEVAVAAWRRWRYRLSLRWRGEVRGRARQGVLPGKGMWQRGGGWSSDLEGQG